MLRRLLSIAALALAAALPAAAQVTTEPARTGVSTAVFLGTGTFAQMKVLANVSDGATYLVTNYGRGGSTWRYSSSAGDWFPTAPVKVYENTVTLTGAKQTAAQVLLAMPMEAGLLTGKTFRVLVTVAKDGATDTVTPVLRMGSAGTAADAAVANYTTLSGASRSLGLELWLRMASATSVERLGGPVNASWGGSSSILVNAAVTVATVASANFLTLTGTMSGTTDSPQLGYVTVEIQP
jgi:hypothetical protein